MKLSKKTIPIAAFALGACVFVSTAFADMTLGTGYDRMKHAIKETAAQMESGLDNYTLEMHIELKENDRVLLQSSNVNKYDLAIGATETTETSQDFGGEPRTMYSYKDRERSIWKHGDDETYYVSEYERNGNSQDRVGFENPFNQYGAAEFERIVDAFVGSLKDQVQAEPSADGSVAYSGSLTEAQVPAVVNAVASFAVLQSIKEERDGASAPSALPDLASDVYVKRVTGTAVENEAGWLERAQGEIVMTGKDSAGNVRDVTASVVVAITNVGATTVAAPDLSDASVEKVSRSGFDDKYVGTYRNDIVVEKEGTFLKIGERTIEITSVDGDQVKGAFAHRVKPEYEAEYGASYDFTFEYEPGAAGAMSFFTYVDAEGARKYGELSPGGPGRLYLQLDVEITGEGSFRIGDDPYAHGEYNLVFEE